MPLEKYNEDSLKNSYVIITSHKSLLKFRNDYVVVYGDMQSAKEDFIKGDTISCVFDLPLDKKGEAIKSIEFHC